MEQDILSDMSRWHSEIFVAWVRWKKWSERRASELEFKDVFDNCRVFFLSFMNETQFMKNTPNNILWEIVVES